MQITILNVATLLPSIVFNVVYKLVLLYVLPLIYLLLYQGMLKHSPFQIQLT